MTGATWSDWRLFVFVTDNRLRVDNAGVVNFFFFLGAFLKSESREYFFNREKYFKIP